MCGICGLFGSFPESIQLISQMTSALSHRGPDGEGHFYDPSIGIALGHRRLSIIDLSQKGHQPMTDSLGRFVITFNGEIYNYQELKEELEHVGYQFFSNTDTEVILASFKEWGISCLDHFRGMFAFALLDRGDKYGHNVKDDKNLPPAPYLFLARDRIGIKPLIYTFTKQGFAFASELHALRKSEIIPNTVSNVAILEYLSFGAVQQPHTIHPEVFHLPPGHAMLISEQGEKKRLFRWWDLISSVTQLKKAYTSLSDEELIKITREKLEEATYYHLVADVPVGSFLSGGVDSAVVTALMQNQTNHVETFTIGFDNKEENIDESDVAGRTAKFIGTNHHLCTISPEEIVLVWNEIIEGLDQPSCDGINTWLVSRFTSNKVKTVISGLGGDELFAGYPYFSIFYSTWGINLSIIDCFAYYLNELMPNRITSKRSIFATPLRERLVLARRHINQKRLRKLVSRPLQKVLPKLDGIPIIPKNTEEMGPISLLSYVELSGYLLSTLLRDSDVMSMAHSLELRPVLLDHELVIHALSLPDSLKFNKNRFKIALIDSMRDLIPEECWKRQKTGFCLPYENWMNNSLNKYVCIAFSSVNAKKILTEKYRQKYLKRAKNRTCLLEMWSIFVLLSWLSKTNGATNFE